MTFFILSFICLYLELFFILHIVSPEILQAFGNESIYEFMQSQGWQILILFYIGIFNVRNFRKIKKGLIAWFLFVICFPINIFGVIFSMLGNIFKSSQRENAFTYNMICFTTIVMEILFVFAVIQEGVTLSMISIPLILLIIGGSIAICFYFRLLEPRAVTDYFLFVLCVPCILIAIFMAIFGVGFFKYMKSVPTSTSSTNKSNKYKIDTDLSGVLKIYDNKGNEVTGIDFIADDGRVFGQNGETYTKK